MMMKFRFPRRTSSSPQLHIGLVIWKKGRNKTDCIKYTDFIRTQIIIYLFMFFIFNVNSSYVSVYTAVIHTEL